MNRYLVAFISSLLFILSHLQALQRDAWPYLEEDGKVPYDCFLCAFDASYYYNVERELLSLILAKGPPCHYTICQKPSIYWGYFFTERYINHLFKHLEYCYKNKNCTCYWPEYGPAAAQISDLAYSLFDDLLTSSPLSNLIKDFNVRYTKTRYYFGSPENSYYFPNIYIKKLNKHEGVVFFIGCQFKFSDYYYVCQDIEDYLDSSNDYTADDVAEIKDKLSGILETLYPKFFSLYSSCYEKHPNETVAKEIQFMRLMYGEREQEKVDSDQKAKCKKLYKIKQTIRPKSRDTGAKHARNKELNAEELFLEQGILLNNLLLHKEAIPVLTLAITNGANFSDLHLARRETYLERAFAYFETDQIDLALKDYAMAKKVTSLFNNLPQMEPKARKFAGIYIPQDKSGFSKGLVLGILDGSKTASVEFVTSLFSSIRGLGYGLWAFVCSPSEVTQEVICAAYSIGNFISTHGKMECLECVVPELRELACSWTMLDDYSRGKKIGFIIGKYGIEIFAPIGGVKAINKIRALKRANTMLTLERCAASEEAKTLILRESAKRADLRKKLVAATIKKGKIAVKSSNTKFHIMQSKHAWEKVIELTGDVEKDFDKVVAFLEEYEISDKSFLSGQPLLFPEKFPKVRKTIHEKTINGWQVHAEFETYIETGEIFLKDAWVVSK